MRKLYNLVLIISKKTMVILYSITVFIEVPYKIVFLHFNKNVKSYKIIKVYKSKTLNAFILLV